MTALTQELGLSGIVHFLGARSDIPQLLAAMDVFVLTSHMEASPVSILEAMAVGKPVVAPRVGSIPDSVVHNETGFLTKPGDVEDSAACLADLLAHPDLAASMGLTGRMIVERRWSLDSMVDGYQRLIEEVLARKTT